jgi:hypothetical protein
VFTTIDALATPALLDFHAVPSGATVTLLARATLPRGAEMVLLGPGGEAARSAGELRKEVRADTPGAYRVEVRVPGAPGTPPVPWLVSNAIYTGPAQPAAPAARDQPAAGHARSAIAPFPWRIEKDPASRAILRSLDHSAELEYTLAAGERRSQFVAIASDVAHQAFKTIDLELSSDRPARVGVNVRAADGRRWGRSFYVDPGGSVVHAALAEMRPIGEGSGAFPGSDAVTSILLVIDLTNAAPGRSGVLRVLSSALAK